MSKDDDPVARMRAQMDQAKEGSKEFAEGLWVFYSTLVSEGFDPEQAIWLTRDFLTTALGNASGGEA